MKDQLTLLAALQRDISDRLRPVCSGLSEESFQELVREIATVKLKYGVDADLPASLKLKVGELMTEPPGDDPLIVT